MIARLRFSFVPAVLALMLTCPAIAGAGMLDHLTMAEGWLDFLLIFFLIFFISALLSGGLLLIRRRVGHRLKDQEYLHTAIFGFFTTLYAFFIGFAIVTLWSTFLTAKSNVNQEADAIITAYYTSLNMTNAAPFRQALKDYVKTVLEDEWPQMVQDSMSKEAARRFYNILAKFSELSGNSDKMGGIYTSLAEAGRQRLSRAMTVKGNLYPTVWIILIFGFGSVVFGLVLLNRQQTVVSMIFEFMLIFMVLSCLLFIFDIDTPFSGFIVVQPDAFKMIYEKMLSLP